MPASLFLHPFRLGMSGRVAVAEQGSDAYIESQLAVVVGTRLGERPMCTPFGVPDAAFAELTAGDIQTCLDVFGPDGVAVTGLTTTSVSDDTDTTVIEWEAA